MPPAPYRSEILSYLLALLARVWPRLGALTAIAGLLTGSAVYFGPRSYTVNALFLPEAGPVSSVSSLAAQFGLDAASAATTESPYYYVELLKTQELLRRVVRYRYRRSPTATDSSLADLLAVDPGPAAMREAATIRVLGERMAVSSERRTGIVTSSIRMPSPQLAYDVSTRLLLELQEFNLTRRQTRASAERKFLDARVTEMRAALARAEDALSEFLQQNRSSTDSPRLRFESDRLHREVQLRAGLLQTVEQSAERARMDEVRNTPQISILQPPRIPAEPDRRNTMMKALTGAIMAFVIWLLLASLGYILRTRAAGDPLFRDRLDFFQQRHPRLRSLSRAWLGF